MRRQQKTTQVDCREEDKVEPENNPGVPSLVKLNIAMMTDGKTDLMEEILDKDNLNSAYLKVKGNKGAPGIDGMSVQELLAYLKNHGEELKDSIRKGEYRPQPVRRVEIPKDGGKGVRNLGIPAVVDRMVQQAVLQVIAPIFDEKFSNSSYGFRPVVGAEDAVEAMRSYYEKGYTHAVDIDLAKYFDTVNHDLLIKAVREELKDERVISLIKKFLKSGVMDKQLVSPTIEGVPQGGPLSPLLSNIYLNKLDKVLEMRGHKFVRYADDCNIYVKSQRAAERVMKNTRSFLESKLKLKINEEKSKVGSPLKLKFLGFSLWKSKDKTVIRVHQKSVQTFKKKVIMITKRNKGRSLRSVLAELKKYTIGWLGYYSQAETKSVFTKLGGWIRARLRMYIWKQWKRVRTRFAKLKKAGLEREKAWMYANTRKGYWRIAHSPFLQDVFSNKRLKMLGYDDLESRYKRCRESRMKRLISLGLI
jgi:group II intron reverse transcriptase/maturase